MTWTDDAACTHPAVDPDWFTDAADHIGPILAMRVCTGCPVRIRCLNEALSHRASDAGVWGGTTLRNRKEIRGGRMTPGRAMALGDRLAALPTAAELEAQEDTA